MKSKISIYFVFVLLFGFFTNCLFANTVKLKATKISKLRISPFDYSNSPLGYVFKDKAYLTFPFVIHAPNKIIRSLFNKKLKPGVCLSMNEIQEIGNKSKFSKTAQTLKTDKAVLIKGMLYDIRRTDLWPMITCKIHNPSNKKINSVKIDIKLSKNFGVTRFNDKLAIIDFNKNNKKFILYVFNTKDIQNNWKPEFTKEFKIFDNFNVSNITAVQINEKPSYIKILMACLTDKLSNSNLDNLHYKFFTIEGKVNTDKNQYKELHLVNTGQTLESKAIICITHLPTGKTRVMYSDNDFLKIKYKFWQNNIN